MFQRILVGELIEAAREYPAVVLFGPRQSGKTTLAKTTFPHLPWISLEDPDVRQAALADPRAFLGQIPSGAILDEIQNAPELLSYLQSILDTSSERGRFILTGSHQPRLRESVSQSLAGRIATLELLPLSIQELLPSSADEKTVWKLCQEGFYPRLHAEHLSAERFHKSYHATYVERDVRVLIQLKDSNRFDTFLRLLAGRIGQIVDYQSLANDVGVSAVTIKDWIGVLKASYLVLELPPWHSNTRKRLVKSSKLFFTDTGLACHLLGIRDPEHLWRDPLRGSLFENMIVADLVKYCLNRGRTPDLHFYRDSNGVEVDLLHADGRTVHPIEIKSASTFHPDFTKGLRSFRKTFASPSGQILAQSVVLANLDRDFAFDGGIATDLVRRNGDWSTILNP
ncbi:MAG: ATP-binding protein [Fibrobacterota bacterium]|nr:ATP-binding protein [Fibrobacterota bacterium]QQS05796.1 MAG: ATP-binding protein [Fibrobacterota bacterium]